METIEKTRSFPNRLICYFVGLFIMTAGIAISVKSNLGVSPVSSIPYTVTRCWGLEMGKATILFHCVLVLIQVLILRKRFQLKSLLQIPVGIVFGYFTTFCNYLMTFAPTVHNFALRIGMCLVSIVLVAIGFSSICRQYHAAGWGRCYAGSFRGDEDCLSESQGCI
ncbi:MAG: YczE/YyaS/YitT family protein [Ruminococcus sp.]